jgi:hypothetical protein
MHRITGLGFQMPPPSTIYTAVKGHALNSGACLWRELRFLGMDSLNLQIGGTDTPKLRAVFIKFNSPPDRAACSTRTGGVRGSFLNGFHGPEYAMRWAAQT